MELPELPEPLGLTALLEPLVRQVLMALRAQLALRVLREPLELPAPLALALPALLVLTALLVLLDLAALSLSAPAQPTCYQLMAVAKLRLTMLLLTRLSSGTTAKVS